MNFEGWFDSKKKTVFIYFFVNKESLLKTILCSVTMKKQNKKQIKHYELRFWRGGDGHDDNR